MDEDAIADATQRWVAADLIDEETAESIRSFEADREAEGLTRRRLVWLLGSMGAVLVGAGVVVFLVTRWGALPVAVRTVLLLLAPTAAAAAGIAAFRRAFPAVGHALWLLGALLVGPAVFGLAELHAPGLDLAWRLVAWGAIALPMGHAFPASIAVALGLVALLAGAGSAASGSDGWFVVGFLGSVIGVARVPTAIRDPDRGQVYGLLGAAAGIGLFLFVSASEGRMDRIDLAWSAVLAGAIVLALGSNLGLGIATRFHRVQLRDASVGLAPLLAAVLLMMVVLFGKDRSWLVVHLLVQGMFLGYVLATAVIGVWVSSRWLVNLAATGFLLLVLINLLMLAGELTGALALIVAGGLLVLVAAVLERGRRVVLARLERT